MKFSELPPSKQWAALKYRGEKLAEVWFKPDGEPLVLAFRIPQENFQSAALGKQLTMENLLKAVAIVADDVELWCHGDVSQAGLNGANPDFRNILPPPPPDTDHLEVFVWLNPPQEAAAGEDSGGEEGGGGLTIEAKWQDAESRWKAILGLEATMDTLRQSTESLLVELEGSLKKTLTFEEKLHALRPDVSNWERAKHRVHFAIPKVKEFIHRAIWAIGAPERKRLEQLFKKEHERPDISLAEMDAALRELEELRKRRHVLGSQGRTVQQEARTIATQVDVALKTLQSNAAANAKAKRNANAGGKFFKDIRRLSGA